jgi:osmotically-inducible protein OsmY
MKKLTILLSASLLTFSSLSMGGCAVTTAGVKKGDERNFARSLNDVNAGRAIKARMSRVEGFKLGGVDVEVAEGIVLLSGNVPREEDRIEAERIAWSAPRISQVGNEIMLKGRQGNVRNLKDGILNKSVRARLTANKNVKGRNFNIEVHDGIVYLMGVARTEEELSLAAHTASTTKGAREVISYVRLADDQSSQYATGPGYNGQPSNVASAPTYTVPQSPYAAPAQPTVLEDDAIESGEPYYLDPQTGERVSIPEGVTPIPYVPDLGPGSLGSGGAPLPPAIKQPLVLGSEIEPSTVAGMTSFPSDDHLGAYRTGVAGEAVSVIESAPYIIDPNTGEIVPVKYEK